MDNPEVKHAFDVWIQTMKDGGGKDSIAAKADLVSAVNMNYQDITKRKKVFDKIIDQMVIELEKHDEQTARRGSVSVGG